MQKLFLSRINKICAVFIVAWICWPWLSQNTGLIGGALFAGVWCISAMAMNFRCTVGIDGALMFFYVLYISTSFFLTGRVHVNYPLYYHVSMVSMFFVPFYMARFYIRTNEKKFMGQLALIAVVCMIVGSLTSSYYTHVDPNIMKTISQAKDTEFIEYRKVGIGSFGFIYMLVIAIIAVVGQFKTRFLVGHTWVKVLLIFMCVAGINCIIDSTFTTALLLSVFGIVLILITQENKAINFITYIIAFVLLIFLSQLIGSWLSTITLESEDVTTRLREIGNLIMGNEGGENTESRMEYFMKSVTCFTNHPIFGYNFAHKPPSPPGNHSEWIDIFAVYGLLGGIPLLTTLILKLKETARAIMQSKDFPFYTVILIVFVVYGFLDPFLHLYNLGFVMFLFVPCCNCISYIFDKKGDLN